MDKLTSNFSSSPDLRRQHGHQDGAAALPERADGDSLLEDPPAHLEEEDRAESRGDRLSPLWGLWAGLPQSQPEGWMW